MITIKFNQKFFLGLFICLTIFFGILSIQNLVKQEKINRAIYLLSLDNWSKQEISEQLQK